MGEAARTITAEDTYFLKVDWVTPERFYELTGVTKRAVEGKIERGKQGKPSGWVLGEQYRYDPDGNVQVSLTGWNEWVENSQRVSGRGRPTSRSGSCGTENAVSKRSRGRRPRQTSNGQGISVLK